MRFSRAGITSLQVLSNHLVREEQLRKGDSASPERANGPPSVAEVYLRLADNSTRHFPYDVRPTIPPGPFEHENDAPCSNSKLQWWIYLWERARGRIVRDFRFDHSLAPPPRQSGTIITPPLRYPIENRSLSARPGPSGRSLATD